MTIKLYKYQLDALTWMKQLETSILTSQRWNYSKLAVWPDAKTNVMFDLEKGWFELEPRNTDHLTTCGGVLADEMGLVWLL
jgi:SNF2 family DNA or RNA helicase